MEGELYVVVGSDISLLYNGLSYLFWEMEVAGNHWCLILVYTVQHSMKTERSTEDV